MFFIYVLNTPENLIFISNYHFNFILILSYKDIKPKKIILVGDSAGGNLAVALTLKCI